MAAALSASLLRLRRGASENALALACVLLLAVNPLYILHTGFIFSFTLVYVLLRGLNIGQAANALIWEKCRWLPPQLARNGSSI